MFRPVVILLLLVLLAGCASAPRGGGSSIGPAPQGYTTVRAGDTLSAIAARAGIPLLRLERFNPAVDARDLAIGQRLMLPDQSERAPGNGQYRYRVRAGDTASDIARHFGTSVSRITAANSGLDADRLRIGQMLTVPVGSASASSRSSTATASSGAAPASAIPRDVGPWAWPANNYRIVRRFGPDARGSLQPMLLEVSGDNRARAVAPGRVRFAGTMRQLGGVVIVHHERNLQSVYAQCDNLLVNNGQQVTTGTPICDIRRDGNGRHRLLFDTRLAGRPFNPGQILR
ncbi:LysM peptidoglycan-binding domain-containing protein [Kushneria aurantia]|uniref:LysM peptidoglycan-binding domain-containing protein n=1 Tax=Kushneria aurantia TaxID=504092 RepID=A0ABV6G465_9GAMM|nr:LysM peptidoglycan-binding domain-containing protein [Kushneria aurantia]